MATKKQGPHLRAEDLQSDGRYAVFEVQGDQTSESSVMRSAQCSRKEAADGWVIRGVYELHVFKVTRRTFTEGLRVAKATWTLTAS